VNFAAGKIPLGGKIPQKCMTACTVPVVQVLYKPMAKFMGMGKFRPPQLRNRSTDFDEMRTLELPSEDHPPRKISF